jgi:NAD(P)-dependent dehydrogenase (short-subunit alcohol dehydrogenase family)
MLECLGCCGTLVLLVLAYKFLDWLVRLLDVGRYSERYILVTGCDTGFGNLLAKRLDALGCHVFAGCLTEAGETDLKKTCSNKLLPISLDVSKPESVRNAFQIVKAKLPQGKGLWGVLNNAGILGPCGFPEWQIIDDYKKVNAVNLYGLIDVTMTFLPLVKATKGRVVNTASVFGRHSLAPCLPYCVSKYGVEAFTDGLRRAMYAFGVKALLIEPGLHRTHITSAANVIQHTEEAWNRTSPEIKEEFGEEFFKYATTQGVQGFDKVSSSRITDVVDAYQHALLGRFPRARYVVGTDAKYLWLPVQWLPEWLGDILMNNFDRNAPKPACLKKR